MEVELVIKLSDKNIEHIKRLGALWIESEKGLSIISKALLDGILLPKGHGRLIDADEIQFENTEFDTYGDYCIAFDAIDQADTIIEADNAEGDN